MTLPCVAFLQKKCNSIEKSYLDHFYGPRNVRNRSSMLEIPFLAPKYTFELVLSVEIDQFEVEEVDLFETLYIFLCPNSTDLTRFPSKIMKIYSSASN